MKKIIILSSILLLFIFIAILTFYINYKRNLYINRKQPTPRLSLPESSKTLPFKPEKTWEPLSKSPIIASSQEQGLIKNVIAEVRRFPNDTSERVSETLMGEQVKILELEKDWVKVELVDQYNYPGWIKSETVNKGTEYSPELVKIIVISSGSSVYQSSDLNSPKITQLLMGSILATKRLEEQKNRFRMVILPDGRAGWIEKIHINLLSTIKKTTSIRTNSLINTAYKLMKVPYLWGGMSEKGIDCSGYVHMIYRANGIKIHRDADLQYYYDGVKVNSNSLQEGDLVFFKNHEEISHVGMYIGNNQFIHSSSRTHEVTISKLNSPYYSSSYAGAKRIINYNNNPEITTKTIETVSSSSTITLPNFNKNYIIIYGCKYCLRLYNSTNNLIKEYPIGIGINGMGKNKAGDKKTPVGEYEIIWKASRFAKEDGGYPIEDGKAFCGPDNIFTTDPDIGYSSESLWTEGYGGAKAVVMCLNYPNSSDKSKKYTGGCIEIHATLLGGIGENSSSGCIRMYPEDSRKLYQSVDIGTKVYIKD